MDLVGYVTFKYVAALRSEVKTKTTFSIIIYRKNRLVSMIKGAIIGFISGAVSVPLATPGLVIIAFEIAVAPILFLPRLAMQVFPTETTPGWANIVWLMVVSGVIYAAVGLVIQFSYSSIRK